MILVPSRKNSVALLRNSVSPSFKDIELTIGFTIELLTPSTKVSKSDESIIVGVNATDEADKSSMKSFIIEASISGWSKHTSRTSALDSTCDTAIDTASCKFSLTSSLNFFEPATLHLSPITLNFLCVSC